MNTDTLQNRQWFLIRTKPRQEHLARKNYERHGLSPYQPQIRAVRRHARRTEEILKPFFLGYLFLHLAPEERRWTTISSTIGAFCPVRFGDYIPTVPESVINELIEREDNQGCIPASAEVRSRFSPGDVVRSARSNSEGLVETLKKILDKDCVLVLLDFMKRQVPVVIPAVDIQATGF